MSRDARGFGTRTVPPLSPPPRRLRPLRLRRHGKARIGRFVVAKLDRWADLAATAIPAAKAEEAPLHPREPVIPAHSLEMPPQCCGLEGHSMAAPIAGDADGRMADGRVEQVLEGMEVRHIRSALPPIDAAPELIMGGFAPRHVPHGQPDGDGLRQIVGGQGDMRIRH
jgi:hypothetical protein